MAGPSIGVSDIAQTLGVTEADLSQALNLYGTTPKELVTHTVKREYLMNGLTPEEFCKKHVGIEVDYKQLQTQFKTFCNDYMEPLLMDTTSYAVEFCSKVIYEIGPEARQVKKADGDKIWKMKFSYKKNSGAPDVKVVFIATFKSDNNTFKKTTEANKMVMTVKQASLLAMDTFCKLADLAFKTNGTILLTPLCGAVFSKTDLEQITIDLQMTMEGLLSRINSSCQSGGHILPHSTGACAAVASLIVTRNIKEDKIRKSIVVKIIKQYFNNQKPINMTEFKIISVFAQGGIPAGFDVESLDDVIKQQQAIKMSTRQAVQAIAQSGIRSVVDTMSPSSQATTSARTTPGIEDDNDQEVARAMATTPPPRPEKPKSSTGARPKSPRKQ